MASFFYASTMLATRLNRSEASRRGQTVMLLLLAYFTAPYTGKPAVLALWPLLSNYSYFGG
jgi:hypothetical protein